MFNSIARPNGQQTIFVRNDCTDNGKPVVKQGRKAVNLRLRYLTSRARKIVWPPKAIGEGRKVKTSAATEH